MTRWIRTTTISSRGRQNRTPNTNSTSKLNTPWNSSNDRKRAPPKSADKPTTKGLRANIINHRDGSNKVRARQDRAFNSKALRVKRRSAPSANEDLDRLSRPSQLRRRKPSLSSRLENRLRGQSKRLQCNKLEAKRNSFVLVSSSF